MLRNSVSEATLSRRLIVVLFALVVSLGSWIAPVNAQEATPTAPTPALPVTVTDNNGESVEVSDISRIIPLNGDIAEIVYDLGFQANVIGLDVSATYPEGWMESVPSIGYQRSLSAEGILSLEPTLVIGNADAGPPEIIDQVKAAGVTVVIIEDGEISIDQPVAKILAVAAALGVPEAGAALAEKTQAEIDSATALAATATSAPRVLFLYVRGADVAMIGGVGTGADVMIEAAGGINAGADLQGFVPMTPEALAAAAPDVLILLSAGLESVGGIDGLLELPGIAQTPAGENRAVLDYDDLYFLGLTPRTGEALTDLIYGLHPELAAATPVASPAA